MRSIEGAAANEVSEKFGEMAAEAGIDVL